MTQADWEIFTGQGGVAPLRDLPPAPGWRTFHGSGAGEVTVAAGRRDYAPLVNKDVVRMVNAAILLRRPLLVTGDPGSGKSTLAKMIARELSLGPVLTWSITSSTQLRHGLYEYDAIGRVHDDNVRWNSLAAGATPESVDRARADSLDIGRYIRLGPLGTALLPWRRPRVLLIDEIDKSDIDLPNDLLHVFEDGYFSIPELRRLPDEQSHAEVWTHDRDGGRREVIRGQVDCSEFPIVLLTSNGERSFPPAFLRRCLRLKLPKIDRTQLESIVNNQIGGDVEVDALLRRFVSDQEKGTVLAADQLLNAVFVLRSGPPPAEADWKQLQNELMRTLAQ